MNIYHHNNQQRADGFARFVRIVALLFAALTVGKCAFGQSFDSPFHMKLSDSETIASHGVVHVAIDTIALILEPRLGKRDRLTVKVQGVEPREGGTFYILDRGVAHLFDDEKGPILAWATDEFRWIFWSYIPHQATITKKGGH